MAVEKEYSFNFHCLLIAGLQWPTPYFTLWFLIAYGGGGNFVLEGPDSLPSPSKHIEIPYMSLQEIWEAGLPSNSRWDSRHLASSHKWGPETKMENLRLSGKVWLWSVLSWLRPTPSHIYMVKGEVLTQNSLLSLKMHTKIILNWAQTNDLLIGCYVPTPSPYGIFVCLLEWV